MLQTSPKNLNLSNVSDEAKKKSYNADTWSPRTISRGKRGGTLLKVPRPVTALGGWADGQSEDGVGVAVTVAVVGVPTTVAGCPDENAALPVPASHDAV